MRAHYADSLLFSHSDGELFVLSGASVSVCTVGTSTPITETLYSGPTGETALTNPLTSGTDGSIEFWLAESAQVDLVAGKAGYSPITRTVEVGSPLFPYDNSVSPTIGDTLVYDGTKYVPQAPSIRVATVEISSAELLDLHNTKKVLVAAPSDPTQEVTPIAIITRYNPGTTPYALGVPNEFFNITQEGADGWSGLDLSTVIGTDGDNARRWCAFNPAGAPYMGTVHRGLTASLSHAITDGNGTVTVTVVYL